MQLRHTHIRRDGAGWIPASLCCLLLLLPMLTTPASALVQRTYEQESEESRQPTEEERSSEDPIDPRSGGRRELVEARNATAIYRKNGNSNCLAGLLGGTPLARLTPAEHQLRNGVGGPLRC